MLSRLALHPELGIPVLPVPFKYHHPLLLPCLSTPPPSLAQPPFAPPPPPMYAPSLFLDYPSLPPPLRSPLLHPNPQPLPLPVVSPLSSPTSSVLRLEFLPLCQTQGLRTAGGYHKRCLCLVPSCRHGQFSQVPEERLPYPHRVHPWPFIQCH